MSRPPMIPAQPSNGRSNAAMAEDLARRLFSVPKSEIDREEKKEAKSRKLKLMSKK